MSDDTKWSLTPTPPPHLLSLFPTFKVTRGKNRSLKVTVSNYVHILRVSIVFLGFERRFFPSKNLFPYQLTSGSASCERSHALRTSNYVVLLNFLRLFPPLSLPCPPLHYPSPPPFPQLLFILFFLNYFWLDLLFLGLMMQSNIFLHYFHLFDARTRMRDSRTCNTFTPSRFPQVQFPSSNVFGRFFFPLALFIKSWFSLVRSFRCCASSLFFSNFAQILHSILSSLFLASSSFHLRCNFW